jgi:hypothetical protein
MKEKIDNKTRVEVLEAVLEATRIREWYLCCRIRFYLCRKLLAEQGLGNEAPPGIQLWNDTDFVIPYFPELLKHKPEGVDLYSNSGWFGAPCEFDSPSAGQRIRVLESLIEEIKLQYDSKL